MLTPEYLQGLPDSIVALYSEAEIAVLKDMARRISQYDYWIPAVEHQKRMLAEAGRSQDEILETLTSQTGKTQRELKAMMREAAKRTIGTDAEQYAEAGMRVPDVKASEPLQGILNAGYRATAGEMRNICRTTARIGSKQFTAVLDSAWTQVQSGAVDINSAIRNAVKQLSESGLKSIRYASGREDTLEVAVRRATVTGVNQTCSQLQEELADEVGCDLVEVSAHAGARPSHALWQGKIYSRSGKSDKYPPFRAATGYGTGTGLAGWNCRHTFAPYVDGAPRVWSEEELKKLDEPRYNYNGKKLTEYEAQQEQRKNERNIRRWKREYAAMDAAGLDTTEAAVELKSARAKQIDFIRQTGLKPQGDREQVAGFGRSQAMRVNAVAKAREKVLAERERNLQFILNDATIKEASGLPKKITGMPTETLRHTISVDSEKSKVLPNGFHAVAPRGVDLIDVEVMAGLGTCTPIRDLRRLYEMYGLEAEKWQKKSGTAYGEKYHYVIHWYENNGFVHIDELKMKGMKQNK